MMKRSSRSPITTKATKSVTPDGSKSPKRQIPNDKVKIYVRVRPSFHGEEWNTNLVIQDQNTIKIVKSDLDSVHMKFDKIFTCASKQDNVFSAIELSIQRFLDGENHSFFAYGQTGAGKTYSMIGDLDEANPLAGSPLQGSKHRGILPRALEKIVGHIQTQRSKNTLVASFFEVYNEKVYDLLNVKSASKREGLELRECKNGTNKIMDLLRFDIRTVEDALQCLRVGLKNRVTGCSHANTKSSRSHSIFELILIKEDEQGTSRKIMSKLRIIDLAGSEKFKIPKDLDPEDRNLHILELTSINGSLSTLGHCITSLADPNRTHIPFRNSKLTRVLSDSLTGDSRISFIVCLSPSIDSAYESFSTLQAFSDNCKFASRAKKIVLDNRHIKKKEAPRTNMRLPNKTSDNVVEIFKQFCSDKKLFDTVFDPVIRSKIDILENEINQLKASNIELQSQVSFLRRSCSPDPSYLKKSTESLPSTYRMEDCTRSVSTGPSPSRTRNQGFQQEKGVPVNRKLLVSQSASGISTAERIARFNDDLIAEKEEKDIERQESSTIFENMSMFKEMLLGSKNKSMSMEELNRMKEQRAKFSRFWNDADPESDDSSNNSEDKIAVIDLISTKNQIRTNLLAQRLKEKEIERKYELFFSLDRKQEGSYTKGDDLEKQASIQTLNLPNRLTNSFASETSEQSGLMHNNDMLVTLPEANRTSNDSCVFYNKCIVDELTEEGLVSDRRGFASAAQEVSRYDNTISNKILKGDEESNDSIALGTTERFIREQYVKYGLEKGRCKTEADYESHGLDIIKEFDKKLMSVHQLNEQHQELIRNIGMKFKAFNEAKAVKPRPFSTQTGGNTDSIGGKVVCSGRSKKVVDSDRDTGRDVREVVKEIKQELCDALSQIHSMQADKSHTESTDALTQLETKTLTWSEQTSRRGTITTGRSSDRFVWDEMRPKDRNLNIYDSGSDSRVNQAKYAASKQQNNGSKSVEDIVKKHWITYKENIK